MVSSECPQCGRQHLQDREFCDCGYPLFLSGSRDDTITGRGSARVPGEDPATAPFPPRPDRPPEPPPDPTSELPAGPLVRCPAGHGNEATRTLCATCGQRIHHQEPQPLDPVEQPAVQPDHSRLLLRVVALAVLLLGLSLLWHLRARDDGAQGLGLAERYANGDAALSGS